MQGRILSAQVKTLYQNKKKLSIKNLAVYARFWTIVFKGLLNYFPADCLMLLAAAKTNASIPTPIITPIIVPIKLLVEPLVVDGEVNVEIALMIDNTRPMRANIHAGIIFELSFDALTEQIPEIKPIIESKQILPSLLIMIV